MVGRLVLALLVGLSVLSRASAQSTDKSPAGGLAGEDSAALALLGPGVLGRRIEVESSADPSRLYVLRPGRWSYRWVSGERRGEEETHVLTRKPGGEKHVVWELAVGERERQHLEVREDGGILRSSEADLTQGVVARYSPAEPILLAGMKPGSTQAIKMGVRIVDLEDSREEKYTGRLDLDYRHLGIFEVTTPAGKFHAHLIRSSYSGNIGPASVTVTEYWFFAEDAGLVAAVVQSRVEAFLVYSESLDTAKVLLRQPEFLAMAEEKTPADAR